jgi:4-carboxymuconolactone decarboxylase
MVRSPACRTPLGLRHWHGASPSAAMTNVAVAEAQDGAVVTWMEPVDAATYRGDR